MPWRSCAALALFLAACAQPAPEQKLSRLEGTAMGAAWHVTVAGRAFTPEERAVLQTELDELLARISRLTYAYDPDSELSRFNRHRSGAPFPVSAETTEVVRSALRFSEQTSGAFDPTVAPLIELWGFGPGGTRSTVPSDAEIAKALRAVGFQNLEVVQDPPALRKEVPELRLDLGAIVPGYAVDQVAAHLSKKGFTDFLVELGGQVFAQGLDSDGSRWMAGVELPEQGAATELRLSTAVPVSNAALATSGSYRKHFIRDGRRFPHLIDPKTGRPVAHLLASATVLAGTCVEADAAATAVMALGPQEGLAWLRRHPGWEALLLIGREDGGFAQVTTKGFPTLSVPPASP